MHRRPAAARCGRVRAAEQQDAAERGPLHQWQPTSSRARNAVVGEHRHHAACDHRDHEKHDVGTRTRPASQSTAIAARGAPVGVARWVQLRTAVNRKAGDDCERVAEQHLMGVPQRPWQVSEWQQTAVLQGPQNDGHSQPTALPARRFIEAGRGVRKVFVPPADAARGDTYSRKSRSSGPIRDNSA